MKKILVVGMNRSGTKWLSNILSSHSLVASIQSKSHGGILETNMFGNFQNYFSDLNSKENYAAFIEMWSQTDFFRISNVDKNYFYQSHISCNFLELFTALMDQYATKKQCTCWLQKTSPLQFYLYAKKLEWDHIIVVERNYFDVVLSMALLKNNTKKIFILIKMALSYIVQWKIQQNILKNSNTTHIYYNDLKQNKQQTIKKLCQKLGISYEEQMFTDSFLPNSTWTSKPKARLSLTDKFLMYLILSIKNIPFCMIKFLYNKNRKWKIVQGSFDQLYHDHGNLQLQKNDYEIL